MKKTQITKMIFTSLAFVGLVLLILPLFMDVWSFYNGLLDTNQGIKLFEQVNSLIVTIFNLNNVYFQQIYATIFAVIAILTIVTAIVYCVFAVLDIAKVKSKIDTRLIKQICSISILILFVLGMVFGSVFTMVNVAEFETINGTNFIAMNSAIGFYMFLIGSFVCGLFGLLATRKKLN